LHDPWLPFATDLEGWANGCTAAELRRARLLGGEAPLFVDELLAVAPRDLVLQFEVKSHADPELASRTVDALAMVLARAGGRRVEVLSFASAAVRAPPHWRCRRGWSSGLTMRRRRSRVGRDGTASWACAWSTSCSRARWWPRCAAAG
jgi:hypothetical protein